MYLAINLFDYYSLFNILWVLCMYVCKIVAMYVFIVCMYKYMCVYVCM